MIRAFHILIRVLFKIPMHDGACTHICVRVCPFIQDIPILAIYTPNIQLIKPISFG